MTPPARTGKTYTIGELAREFDITSRTSLHAGRCRELLASAQRGRKKA